MKDAIKKTSKDELPDFYNILLERPKDDAKGYDVLFIDAASKVACRCAISSVAARSYACIILIFHAHKLRKALPSHEKFYDNTCQCAERSKSHDA